MKKSILILTIFLLGLTQFSCKDDEQPLTKKDLLTGKTWIITSKALNPSASMGGIVITDVSILDSDDQRNFSFKYNADGTMFQYNKLNQKIFQSIWAFNADETKITHTPGVVFNYSMVGDMSLITMNIHSITADEVVAKIPYTFAGTTYEVTFTYKPK